MAPAEGALTIDVVLDELQRLVSAAVSEEDAGAASYEELQGRVEGLSLHALTYIRFLENHGYLTYDRAADKIAVSDTGRAAVGDPTIWQDEVGSAFADQLLGDGTQEEDAELDDIMNSIGDLDIELALDEAPSEPDISMANISSGRLGGARSAAPVVETQPVMQALDSDRNVPKEKHTASATAGKSMSQQDQSSRRLGAAQNASAGARPNSTTSSSLYDREDRIGSGGMGTVFRARQTKLDRLVAVKEIKEIFDVFAGVQRSDIVARFTEIVQTQSRLLHPNIIQVIDLDTEAKFPFVVMQYAPNGNLRRLIETSERPSLQIALKYFLQILHALNTAHEHGVTHGGIKPENVVLDHAGNALLTDFGISGVAELDANRGATQVYVGVGTVAYMSPEQFRDPNSSSVKSDIYSLGIMFYEMLTGKVPGRRSPMPSSFFPDIPRALDDVFDRMSMDDSDERYGSIQEVLDDIYGSEDVMKILDKRGGFLFLRDPMKHGAAGVTADDEELFVATGSAVEEALSYASEAEMDDPSEAEEELELSDAESGVLDKLDKYGEMFADGGSESEVDDAESEVDDESDSEVDDSEADKDA